MKQQLFTYGITPKLNICQWHDVVDAPWHTRRRYDTFYIKAGPAKHPIEALLCTYCFIIWEAEAIKMMKAIGMTKEEIHQQLMDAGPINAENLKGIREDEREERRARRDERIEAGEIAG